MFENLTTSRYRGQIWGKLKLGIDAQVAGLPGHLELGTRKIANAMATKSFSLCQNAKAIVTFSTNVMRTNSVLAREDPTEVLSRLGGAVITASKSQRGWVI